MVDSTFESIDRWETVKALLPAELRIPGVFFLLQLSLEEDLIAPASERPIWPNPAAHDITSQATLSDDSRLQGRITAKAEGIIAGLPVAHAVFQLVDPLVQVETQVKDGQKVHPGTLLAEVTGPGQSLLAAERTALNFLGRLSGIATLTHHFVQAVAGTHAIILDTRKTAPGFRMLDKYAVCMGGGRNHRTGLFDMVLIKDNHIDGAGGIKPAVERVRQRYGERYQVEVEVKDLDEVGIALKLPINRIMLDNMDIEMMREAVRMSNGRIPLEASCNVSLANVRAIAETGVDFISSGSLTHSAPVLDISMRLR